MIIPPAFLFGKSRFPVVIQWKQLEFYICSLHLQGHVPSLLSCVKYKTSWHPDRKRVITKQQYINRHIRIKLHSCEIGTTITNFDDIRKSLTVLKTFKNSLKWPFCLISFLFCVCQRHAISFSFRFIYETVTEFCKGYC